MASALATDMVVSFEINPGTLDSFLKARAEGGPRLKCFEGSVTLVSSGMPHGIAVARFSCLILAVCLELRAKLRGAGATTWKSPIGDTAYEADASYYLQHFGRAGEGQPPDLAIEIVVSHPETIALRAGALLNIPELWVLDLPRHRLTFYHLATRGKQKGDYRPEARSRAFPGLTSAEVLERLDDPEAEAAAFHENCRAWAREVLVPRLRADQGGA